MNASPLILLARIVGAHGIKGDVLLHVFAQEPKTLLRFSFPAGALSSVRPGPKGSFIGHIKGVDDRSGAEALKGQEMTVTRADLPEAAEDEYYISDLVGLATLYQGQKIGQVIGVPDFGAGQLLDIRLDSGRGLFLPFDEDHVGAVDLTAKTIEVDGFEAFL